ncbi:MAG: ABC transporter permease subunit [Pseudonocardiaceae bacterium]
MGVAAGDAGERQAGAAQPFVESGAGVAGREVAAARPLQQLATATALALVLAGSLVMGVLAARFRDSTLDWFVRTVSYTNAFVPSFWVALLAIYFFSVWLGWLPATGAADLRSAGGPTIDLAHLVLPAVTLALTQHGVFTLYVRSTVLETMREDHVRFARAQGASETSEYLVEVIGSDRPGGIGQGNWVTFENAWPMMLVDRYVVKLTLLPMTIISERLFGDLVARSSSLAWNVVRACSAASVRPVTWPSVRSRSYWASICCGADE